MAIIILAIMFWILYVISFTSFISTITLHSGIYYPLLPQSSDRLSHLSKVTQQIHSSARLCTHVCLKSILGAPAPLWGRKYIKGGGRSWRPWAAEGGEGSWPHTESLSHTPWHQLPGVQSHDEPRFRASLVLTDTCGHHLILSWEFFNLCNWKNLTKAEPTKRKREKRTPLSLPSALCIQMGAFLWVHDPAVGHSMGSEPKCMDLKLYHARALWPWARFFNLSVPQFSHWENGDKYRLLQKLLS